MKQKNEICNANEVCNGNCTEKETENTKFKREAIS